MRRYACWNSRCTNYGALPLREVVYVGHERRFCRACGRSAAGEEAPALTIATFLGCLILGLFLGGLDAPFLGLLMGVLIYLFLNNP